MARRHDLDALRAIAMLLGILLHGALPFIPRISAIWAVQDSQQREWMGIMLYAIHGFRMPLFFLISGFFTAMLWRKRGLKALLHHRFKRIFLPMMIGLFTVIPATWISYGILRDTGTTANNSNAQSNETPVIITAAATGNAETLKVLIAGGADVNARDNEGNTPLHAAIFFGRAEVVEILLDADADLSPRNQQGNTPAEGLKAPWSFTKPIADQLQIRIEQREFERGRAEIAEMLGAPKSTAPPNTADIIGMLIQFPLWGHLWFLWFLCWLVAAFAILISFARSLSIPTLPGWVTFGPWPYLVLIPLTALAEYWMNSTGQTEFGPATSVGLLPMPSVLFYYALFFFFGALYYEADDQARQLGKNWWYTLPFALVLVFPLGIISLKSTDTFGSLVSALCQSAYAWLVSIGLIGLFRGKLSGENHTMRYLSDSSYWLYLIHIPLIFYPQHLVSEWSWPPLIKLLIVCAMTSAMLLLTYQLFVRYTPIGTLLNGRRVRIRKSPVEP